MPCPTIIYQEHTPYDVRTTPLFQVCSTSRHRPIGAVPPSPSFSVSQMTPIPRQIRMDGRDQWTAPVSPHMPISKKGSSQFHVCRILNLPPTLGIRPNRAGGAGPGRQPVGMTLARVVLFNVVSFSSIVRSSSSSSHAVQCVIARRSSYLINKHSVQCTQKSPRPTTFATRRKSKSKVRRPVTAPLQNNGIAPSIIFIRLDISDKEASPCPRRPRPPT